MACALLCAVAGDNGAGMAAAAQGGALARDGGIAGRGAGVGRRVVAWRWRGGGRGLWRGVGRGLSRARCFALLQVTAGRAWPQRRRAGHWHGTGPSQGRALSLARGGDGANESSSAGRAGQGAGAERGGGVVRGCGRAPVPLVFRAARWRRGGRGQQRRTSTGGHWRIALLGGDGADESSSAGRAGQGTGAGRGGAVVHGAAGARGMGGGGVGVLVLITHKRSRSAKIAVHIFIFTKGGNGQTRPAVRRKKWFHDDFSIFRQ